MTPTIPCLTCFGRGCPTCNHTGNSPITKEKLEKIAEDARETLDKIDRETIKTILKNAEIVEK